MEPFNVGFHDECLNENLFGNLVEARQVIETWRIGGNVNRPHTSLAGQTPTDFAQRLRSTRRVSFELCNAPAKPVLIATHSTE